jgi:hypothetical protein
MSDQGSTPPSSPGSPGGWQPPPTSQPPPRSPGSPGGWQPPPSSQPPPTLPGGPGAGWQPPPPPVKRHTARNWVLGIVGGVALLLIGVGIGAAGKGTPGPAPTVTVTAAAAPAPTVTVQVSAPPPAAGTLIGRWSGSGNQVTPAFNAPASGNYIVKWAYSGNVDPSFGSGTNFAISTTDPNAQGLGLPNDIAASGHGSTEVTGASGSQSFNVQAAGHWTIKVISAP